MLNEISELLKVLAANHTKVKYIEYRRGDGGEHFTFSTFGMIKNGEKNTPTPEDWTPCDLCNQLGICLVDGDLVNVQDITKEGRHFKPTSLYKCPLGLYPPHLPPDDEDEEEDDGDER